MKNNSQSVSFEGTVLWFNDKKGYGFIEVPALKQNVFVHHSKIQGDIKWKSLSKSQIVDFDLSETTKGLQALNVRERKLIPVKARLVEEPIPSLN